MQEKEEFLLTEKYEPGTKPINHDNINKYRPTGFEFKKKKKKRLFQRKFTFTLV